VKRVIPRLRARTFVDADARKDCRAPQAVAFDPDVTAVAEYEYTGVSERTVQRDWDKARIFLHRSFQQTGGNAP